MQYINKQDAEPADWDQWFTVPPNRRSFNYGQDSGSLPNLRKAKEYLINEQNGLCAYCQQKIEIENSSIEHVIPKEHNIELSTSYYNLVAVCNKNQIKDPETNKFHCDRNRGSELISPIIFYSNSHSGSAKINCFFTAYADGQIVPKHNIKDNIKNQVQAFIDILNLNHANLLSKRAKDTLNGLTAAYKAIPDSNSQKGKYWNIQYNRLLSNVNHPFREYILIYIGNKLGMY
jgi:uncharacterized protein (TIGR02646 family)